MLFVASWGLLLILMLRRDVFIATIDHSELLKIEQAAATEYQAIYFRNSKIGYVVNTFSGISNDRWQLDQQAQMNLNVSQITQTIRLSLKATLSADNLLQNFDFSFQSPFYQMTANGVVTGSTVNYTLTTGTNTIHDTISFQTPPFLSTSRRAFLLTTALKAGEKRKIPWFDPVSLTAKNSILEYRGKESILINGRVERLHRFTESFSGTRVNSWLNDRGTVIKEESPAGFVFLKEPKFKALALSASSDEILSAVAIKTVGKIITNSKKTMQYRLGIPDDVQLDLDGGRQRFLKNILTVTLEEIPNNNEEAKCTDLGSSTSPTAYVQSEHPKITELTSQLIDGHTLPLDRVRELATWVYTNLDKRPVLGLPDALTTLDNRQGDCNEHAALFAALARNAAIPTRIVAGVTHHKDAFYYHAWNEVCLADQWISIDTTTNQFPADLTHLRFVQGEMQEQVRIGGLLGKLTIEQLNKIQ